MKNEIIQVKGEVQLMKRDWWQVYKRGWKKHRALFKLWWIRFRWDVEDDIKTQTK